MREQPNVILCARTVESGKHGAVSAPTPRADCALGRQETMTECNEQPVINWLQFAHIADSARPGFWLASAATRTDSPGSGRARPFTPGGRVGAWASLLGYPSRRPSPCVILVPGRTSAGLGCRGHCQHAVSAGLGMWLPACSSAGVITGTGKRLGADHIGFRGPGARSSCQGRSRRTLGRWIPIRSTVFVSSVSHPSLGPQQAHRGSRPRSRRAGCQASPEPRASVRPIATSAHPARCLTERRPRRRGTWGPCRRADLRSSLSRWPASRQIMYGCIVFTY